MAEHLAEAQAAFKGGSETERLRAWAEWARPGDAYAFEVRGFGVAGFQYLRMLFGADTIKPDVHIRRYVEGVLGRPVGDVALVGLLEAAAQRLGRRAAELDRALWAAATGQ
ncbi:MAG: hypothetical protein R3B68_12860 [Phycisphaerales bacterium]